MKSLFIFMFGELNDIAEEKKIKLQPCVSHSLLDDYVVFFLTLIRPNNICPVSTCPVLVIGADFILSVQF